MKLTITIVFALCFGRVTLGGLLSGFLEFADFSDHSTGNDTNGFPPFDETGSPPHNDPQFRQEPAFPPIDGLPPFEGTGSPPHNDPQFRQEPAFPLIAPGGDVSANTPVFPPDPNFPLSETIQLPGDTGNSGDPFTNMPLDSTAGQSNVASGPGNNAVDAGWPSDFPFSPNEFPPFDSAQGGMDIGQDPFAPVSHSELFPPLEEAPLEKTGSQLDVSHFLPSIPTNSKVENLITGNTGIFNPGTNWFGDNSPTEFPTEPTTTTQVPTQPRATKPRTTQPPITPPPTKPPPTMPIVTIGGLLPDQVFNRPTIEVATPPVRNIPPVNLPVGPSVVPGEGKGVQAGTINIADSGSNMPMETDVIPLGPAIGMPIDLSPPKQKNPKRRNGNKKGVPDEWMVLYPKGRPPKRKAVAAPSVDAVVPTLNTDEFWQAQNTLNSFSRDRSASLRYRKHRRDKAKQQRRQRKQQRQQNRDNNRRNRGQPPAHSQQQRGGKGPKGAKVAKMVLPNTRKPFVGKRQRGRSSHRSCTRLQRRRGLCDNQASKRSNSVGSKGNRRTKRQAGRRGRGRGGRRRGGHGRGRGGGGRGGRNLGGLAMGGMNILGRQGIGGLNILGGPGTGRLNILGGQGRGGRGRGGQGRGGPGRGGKGRGGQAMGGQIRGGQGRGGQGMGGQNIGGLVRKALNILGGSSLGKQLNIIGGQGISGQGIGGQSMRVQDIVGPGLSGQDSVGPGMGGQDIGGHAVDGHGIGGHDVDVHAVDGHGIGGHDVGGHAVDGHGIGGHEVGGHVVDGHGIGGHDVGGHAMDGHGIGGHDVGGHAMDGHDIGGLSVDGRGRGRRGRKKNKGRKGKTFKKGGAGKQLGNLVQNEALHQQQVVNFETMPTNLVKMPNGDIIAPPGQPIDNVQAGNGRKKNRRKEKKRKGKRTKTPKIKEIKKLVPIDLSGLGGVKPVKTTTAVPLSGNTERIAGLGTIDWGDNSNPALAGFQEIAGFGDIQWDAAQGPAI